MHWHQPVKIIPWTSTFIDPTITSTERDDATFISKWAHKAQLVTVHRYWDVYAFVAPLVITLSMIGIETPLGRGTGSTEVLHQRLVTRRQSRALPDPTSAERSVDIARNISEKLETSETLMTFTCSTLKLVKFARKSGMIPSHFI